jgi:hypothetical protein
MLTNPTLFQTVAAPANGFNMPEMESNPAIILTDAAGMDSGEEKTPELQEIGDEQES